MGALTGSSAAVKTKSDEKRVLEAAASTDLWGGAFALLDADGKLKPNATATAGIPAGINEKEIQSADTVRQTPVSVRGLALCSISSVALTDIGKPVYCATDNPWTDATLTHSQGIKQLGHVSRLEYDASGAVSGKAWVAYDFSILPGLRSRPADGYIAGYRKENGTLTFWDDFLEGSWTEIEGQARWKATLVDGGPDNGETLVIVDSEPDGYFEITTNDAAGDQNSLQPSGALFTPSATNVIYFECRFKVEDTSETNFVVGLCAPGGDRYNAAGGGFFFRMDNDDNLDAVSEKTASEDAQDTTVDLVDDTFVTVAVLWDGTDAKFYVNGTLYVTVTDTNDLPVGTDLVPTLEVEAAGAAAEKMTVDYILCRQWPIE